MSDSTEEKRAAIHIGIGASVGAFLVLTVCLIGSWTEYGRALRANHDAAITFVENVESGWPYDRSQTLKDLENLERAYFATGEDDAVKLAELRRLHDWAGTAHSVADQQQFLSEVRNHGMVYAHSLFLREGLWILAFLGACLGALAMCVFYICLEHRTKKQALS